MKRDINTLVYEVKRVIRACSVDVGTQKEERWVTLENGARVLIDGKGIIIRGLGGKFKGKNIRDIRTAKRGTPPETKRIPDTPSKPLSEDLKEYDGNHVKAAQAFYRREFQGKHVVAKFGDLGEREVFFTSEGIHELRKNMNSDPLKAQIVPKIPDIIKNGKLVKSMNSYKKGDKTVYHYFAKKIDVGNKTVTAIIDVKEHPKGRYSYSLYNLNHSKSGSWNKKVHMLGLERGKIAEDRSNGSSVILTGQLKRPSDRDSIPKNTENFNNEIFNIFILADEKKGGVRDVNMRQDRIALDESARRYDANGYLHVANSHISKETVNPYYGSEIMELGGETLGLEPDKIYYGYRPGAELEKAAATFNGLPLLFEHHFDSAAEPQKDHRVGSLGTNAAFNAPYLDNSLIVTDAKAIVAIENGDYKELSSAYRYTPEFTSGEFQGQKYDFVMRDIVGNHVALVQEGRAGRDVAVADSQIKNKGDNKGMDKMKELIGKLMELLGSYSVEDMEPATEEVLEKTFAGAEEDESSIEEVTDSDVERNTAMDDLMEAVAAIEDPELAEKIRDLIGAVGEDEETAPNVGIPEEGKAQDSKAKKKKTAAMDADAIKKAVEKSMREKHAAARDCAPLCGEIVDPYAFDSASDIYKKALELVGVDVSKYSPSAYKGMVDMLKKSENRNTFSAADSKVKTNIEDKYFAGLDNIRIAG